MEEIESEVCWYPAGPGDAGEKLSELHHHAAAHISPPTASHHPLAVAASSPRGPLRAVPWFDSTLMLFQFW